jgi:hypothetical protein
LIGDEIGPLAALQSDVIYTYIITEDQQVLESSVVRKGLMDKYTYTYNPRGILIDTRIHVSEAPKEEI